MVQRLLEDRAGEIECDGVSLQRDREDLRNIFGDEPKKPTAYSNAVEVEGATGPDYGCPMHSMICPGLHLYIGSRSNVQYLGWRVDMKKLHRLPFSCYSVREFMNMERPYITKGSSMKLVLGFLWINNAKLVL